jgi:hypothetical protein
VLDQPDFMFTHRVGALKRADSLLHYYHGFLYSFTAWNRMVNSWPGQISHSCFNNCGDVCPFVDGVDD